MIKINESYEKIKKGKNKFWRWFEKYHLKECISIFGNDKAFQRLYFGKEIELLTPELIKSFLLADTKGLKVIKQQVDNSEETIKEETREYLFHLYDLFRNSQAAKIYSIISVPVCPYCGMEFLPIGYNKGGVLKYWGDIDHFYSRSRYPGMSICFYNLIPSCKICNQIKQSKDVEFLNPYDKDYYSKYHFRTDFDNTNDISYLLGLNDNFRIRIDAPYDSNADISEIKTFCLEDRYSSLKSLVKDIIIKSRAYENIYLDNLIEKYDISHDEIKQALFDYDEDEHEKIFSRFNKDIAEEFLN